MKNQITLMTSIFGVLLPLLACTAPAAGEITPMPTESKLGLVQTVTVNGIRVRLMKATFYSNETRLWLELQHPTCSTEDVAGGSLFVPMNLEQDLVLQGFEDAEVRGERTPVPQSNIERIQLTLGPVIDPGQLAVVEILRLRARQSSGIPELVEGPWRFEFTPGAAAMDPKDIQVVVDQSAERDGVKIDVERIQLSGSRIRIFCDITLNLKECVEDTLPAPMAAVIYPDGTFVDGKGDKLGTFGCGLPGRQKSFVIDFPPLPEGVSTFILKFGEFLKVELGNYAVKIPLPDEVGGVDTANLNELLRFPSGHRISLAGEELRVDYIELGRDQHSRTEMNVVGLAVETVNPSEPPVVLLVPSPQPTLSDNKGNTYEPTGSWYRLHRSESGQMQAVGTHLRFVGPLQPGATELRLMTDTIGRILKGPWTFEVTIPE